jgi:hypothetical protein
MPAGKGQFTITRGPEALLRVGRYTAEWIVTGQAGYPRNRGVSPGPGPVARDDPAAASGRICGLKRKYIRSHDRILIALVAFDTQP